MSQINIAAKQKRAQEWQYFVDSGQVQDPKIRNDVVATLAQFRQTLAQIGSGAAGADITQKVADLERRLEQLNEEARMNVVGRIKSPQTVKVI